MIKGQKVLREQAKKQQSKQKDGCIQDTFVAGFTL